MAPKKNNATGNGAAAAATAGDNANAMSPAEMEFLVAYFKHCSAASKPDPVDWQALGALFDLKDKKNVMQRFNRLCAKFGFFKAEPAADADSSSTPGGAPAGPTKKKNTGGRRKKKNAVTAPAPVTTSAKYDDDDGDDADGEVEAPDGPSPLKKRKVEDGMNEV
ncbi:hypothetical protein PG994_001400 [Apiospora phragmitis]|uniref:Uncharacterized protein n=1 Tax=Apiospora phragmitis TaxID=2905665 RepID=A0ABR1WTE9_9PEZI